MDAFQTKYAELFAFIDREYPGFWAELSDLVRSHRDTIYTTRGAVVREMPSGWPDLPPEDWVPRRPTTNQAAQTEVPCPSARERATQTEAPHRVVSRGTQPEPVGRQAVGVQMGLPTDSPLRKIPMEERIKMAAKGPYAWYYAPPGTSQDPRIQRPTLVDAATQTEPRGDGRAPRVEEEGRRERDRRSPMRHLALGPSPPSSPPPVDHFMAAFRRSPTPPDQIPRGEVERCWNCGSSRHFAHSCDSVVRRQFCYRCGRSNTTIRECPDCREEWRRQGPYIPGAGHPGGDPARRRGGRPGARRFAG